MRYARGWMLLAAGLAACAPEPVDPIESGSGTGSPTARRSFVYALASEGSDLVQAFRPDPDTGLLTPIGRYSRGGPEAYESVAVDPGGRFLYVIGDYRSDTVRALRIDPETGALSAGVTTSVPRRLETLGLHPSGRFAYLLVDVPHPQDGRCSSRGEIHLRTVDPATGTLGSESLQVLRTVNVPEAVAVHPAGRFLYAAGAGEWHSECDLSAVGAVAAYTVDPASGRLTEQPGSPLAAGSRHVGLQVTPSGDVLYTYQQADGGQSTSVMAHRIDASTGAPTLVQTQVLPRAYGFFYRLDPMARFLNVLVIAGPRDSVELHVFDVLSDGRLRPVSESPVPTWEDTGPFRETLAFEPGGRFAYQASGPRFYDPPRGIDIFTVHPVTGALTPLPGSPMIVPDVGAVALVTVP